MPRAIWAFAKNYLLFLLVVFSSIVFMIAIAHSSLQSTAATLPLTTPPSDGDSKQQGVNHADIALVNNVELLPLSNTTINNATIPADLILNTGQCLGEWAIYIHGVWTDRDAAIEQAERIDLSLPSDKKIPIFVFLWAGDTSLSPFGWDRAKNNADTAGHELADIIAEPKSICPTDKIRLIAHSLGSRVILSALDSLENNTRWKEERHNITTVHLMGAAIDDEKISQDLSDIDYSPFDDGKVYGNAIERNVMKFYNLHNPEDDMLERVNLSTMDPAENNTDNLAEFYPRFERDDALGSLGIQQASIDEVDTPSNYEEKNVQNEILPIKDANGNGVCDVLSYIHPFNCTISANLTGDNHLGYMGFRDPVNHSSLTDDGAMNIVVSDWLSESP